MFRLSLVFFIFIGSFLFISCKENTKELNSSEKGEQIKISYAKGFTIEDFNDHYILTVRDPLDSSKTIQQYYLYRSLEPEIKIKGMEYVHIPITDLASLSTTHLPFLEALKVEDKLIAFSGLKYIYSEKFNQRIEENLIYDIGNEGGINVELLVVLQPDIIMAYNSGNPEYDQFDKMRSLKLIPVLNNEYLELIPLGQAEWIKFVATFFDKLSASQNLFSSVEAEYKTIQKITDTIQNKPTVFTGLAFKGEWTVPGGKSFAATFLKDAGANYIWSADDKTGNFPVAFEEVINKTKDADFWIHPGASQNLQEMVNTDIRFNYFNAFRIENVYNNNNRVNSAGGNDYWESAVFAPQVVLKDLVKIFHPELMLNHSFVYYKHLN